MRVAEEIDQKLRAAFAPAALEVVDDSASHAGHAGAPAAGQSHFKVHIRAQAFAGQSRIARHRAVHAAIGPELMGRIHALAIDVDVADAG